MSLVNSKFFSASFVDRFPGLAEDSVVRSKQTPHVLHARVTPTPVANPQLLTWSDDLARDLGLPSFDDLTRDAALREEWTSIVSGNLVPSTTTPVATRYGGHQFGHWAGQLGDGRAILLGELDSVQGKRHELQLKGAGPTPYSRRADGRAVLRSSLREYLCSEAMHHLGIPTTRALSCVLTGDLVTRDMFYDGRPEDEPGAITSRLAPSFLRFGHFEILASEREDLLLKQLISYTLNLSGHARGDTWDEKVVSSWFRDLCLKTADLMCHWLRVGFVHGVMNTDNMSVLGLTIDYGPYGWLDTYDPTWTPNTTDSEMRRYRYEAQPQIAHWNLARLAEALATVVSDKVQLEEGLKAYITQFQNGYRMMRFSKLGMTDFGSPDDRDLLDTLEELMTSTEVDMTIFYRSLSKGLSALSFFDAKTAALDEWLAPSLYEDSIDSSLRGKFLAWLRRYGKRMATEPRSLEQIVSEMNAVNPYFILRNYLVQSCLDELKNGKRDLLDQLSAALKDPYLETSLSHTFFLRRPEWARRRAGCSSLSCSS